MRGAWKPNLPEQRLFMMPCSGRHPRKTLLIITDTDLAATKPLVKSLGLDAFSFAEAVQSNNAFVLTVMFIAFPYVRIYCRQTLVVTHMSF
jgi:hypothetical protein